MSEKQSFLCFQIALTLVFTLVNAPQAFAQEITKKAKKASKSFVRKAERAKSEKDFAGAEADYRRALGSNGKNAEANYNFGHLYADHDKQMESMSQLLHTAKNATTKPLRHKAFHNLGNAYMDTEDYAQAVQAYKDALRNDPTDDETRYNLAIAKDKLEEQQSHSDDDDDQDQDDDQNQDQDQDDQDQDGSDDEEDEDENQDKQDGKDNQENEDQGDNNDKSKDNKEGDKDKDQQDQDQQNQGKDEQDQDENQSDNEGGQGQENPEKGDFSKEHAENLLRAAENLEKKVQQKRQERKAKEEPSKNPNEKDW